MQKNRIDQYVDDVHVAASSMAYAVLNFNCTKRLLAEDDALPKGARMPSNTRCLLENGAGLWVERKTRAKAELLAAIEAIEQSDEVG